MARRKIFTTLGFIGLLCSVGLIPPASAHNPEDVSPPSECRRFVLGHGNTSHSATVTDFGGNVRSIYGPGESVHVNASASSSTGKTDVNRVRYVWIDPTGTVIEAPVMTRGNQSPAAWSVVVGLTAGASGSTSPIGTWTVFMCYETPHIAGGQGGVTHHIDVAIYNVGD
ncbi:MAG: hypothetical protein HY267_07955 [Deltaproteobacteria bacterium]|nr:hypothetical protein [Deltaproteobacteria bacterium]